MAKSGGAAGDHSARSLAEILQEHGLETELGTRPGRRRKEDAPKAGWPARPAPEDQPPSRLRPAVEPSPGTTPPRAAPPQAAAPYADILREHGLESAFGTRPDRRRDDEPKADWPARPAPEDQPRSRLKPPPEPAAPRKAPGPDASTCTPSPRSPGAAAAAAPVAPVPRTPSFPDVPLYGRRSTDASLPPSLAPGAMPAPSGPSTAAIPGLRPSHDPGSDDGASSGPAGALAWARFVGELVVALAAGVGIYFAFTVLWELLPYVAVLAAPLTVTALVAGVSVWRHRHGQAQLGVRLLAALLFAGTLLVIAPAAGLLAGS